MSAITKLTAKASIKLNTLIDEANEAHDRVLANQRRIKAIEEHRGSLGDHEDNRIAVSDMTEEIERITARQLAARGIAKKLDLVKFAKEHAPTVEHPFEFFPKAPKKGRPACLNMPYVGGSEYATGFVRPDKSDEEIPLEECRIGRGVAYCEGVSPRGRDYYDSILALAGDKFAPHVMASLSHIELKSKLHNQLCRKHAKAALEIVKKNVINARLLECLDYLISNIETGPGYVDNPEFRKLSAGYIRWSA